MLHTQHVALGPISGVPGEKGCYRRTTLGFYIFPFLLQIAWVCPWSDFISYIPPAYSSMLVADANEIDSVQELKKWYSPQPSPAWTSASLKVPPGHPGLIGSRANAFDADIPIFIAFPPGFSNYLLSACSKEGHRIKFLPRLSQQHESKCREWVPSRHTKWGVLGRKW